MAKEKQPKYDNEVSHKINVHIRNCSEEQRKEEVSAFDEMCNKFKKWSFKNG